MAISLYSLILTGIKTGKKIDDLLDTIVSIKNSLEKDFRYNQHVFRNKKTYIGKILNDRTLSLKSMEEKLLIYENEKKMFKKNFENNQKQKIHIKDNLDYITRKVESELKFYEKKSSELNFYLVKNEKIISICKFIQKIILEENRIPDLKFNVDFNYANENSIISSINVAFKSNENNNTDKLNDLFYFKDKELISAIMNNPYRIENYFYLDETLITLESILKIPSQKLNINNNSNLTVKENIINLLIKIIDIKKNENFNLNQKISSIESNKNSLKESFGKLKDFYNKQLFEFNKRSIKSNLDIKGLEETTQFLENKEKMAKKSIDSIIDDIKFYSQTYKNDEKIYSQMVERTKYFVKAINQIKKFMINNFSHLKDYLISKKL